MKRFVSILLVVLFIAAVFAVPVLAQGLQQAVETASAVQLYIVGLASTVIIYLVKLILTRFPKVKLTRAHLSVLIYVVALGLSFAFGDFVWPVFPEFGDPLTFASALLVFTNALLLALAAPVSLATLFYNILLKRVLDASAVKAGLIEEPKAEPVLVAKK